MKFGPEEETPGKSRPGDEDPGPSYERGRETLGRGGNGTEGKKSWGGTGGEERVEVKQADRRKEEGRRGGRGRVRGGKGSGAVYYLWNEINSVMDAEIIR